MKPQPLFRGVFPAMVTPFTDDGAELSEERLRSYCDFLVDRGVGGLFAFGTTGEWPLLSESERVAGTRIIVEQVRGRVPVIVHVGAHRTEQAVRLAVEARAAGASAVSLVSPPFFPLDDDALHDHFTAVARAVAPLAVLLYNIPEMAGNDISPRLFLRVAERADNVAGMKYSGDSLTRIREYRLALGPTRCLFNGNDSLALPALHEGVDGLVSGNGSALPEVPVSLEARFREGGHAEAAALQRRLDEFIAGRDPACELSSFKALLALRGVPVGDARPPLKKLDDRGRKALARFLP
jgi:dihydrodipicolinate synthase/N-acetylneuraminate lyase